MWNLYDRTFFFSRSHFSSSSVTPRQKITCMGHAVAMMVHIFNLLHQQNNIADDFFFFVLGSFFYFNPGRFSSSLLLSPDQFRIHRYSYLSNFDPIISIKFTLSYIIFFFLPHTNSEAKSHQRRSHKPKGLLFVSRTHARTHRKWSKGWWVWSRDKIGRFRRISIEWEEKIKNTLWLLIWVIFLGPMPKHRRYFSLNGN